MQSYIQHTHEPNYMASYIRQRIYIHIEDCIVYAIAVDSIFDTHSVRFFAKNIHLYVFMAMPSLSFSAVGWCYCCFFFRYTIFFQLLALSTFFARCIFCFRNFFYISLTFFIHHPFYIFVYAVCSMLCVPNVYCKRTYMQCTFFDVIFYSIRLPFNRFFPQNFFFCFASFSLSISICFDCV